MLGDEVAAVLARRPGLTETELADVVGGVPEGEVAFTLFADHGRFRCEKGLHRRWHLTAPTKALSPPARGSHAPKGSSTRLALYPWQADALAAWDRAGRRGVVEAVTGAGKTRVGVAATLAEVDRRGQVLVLVPTVELAHQWVAELTAHLPGGCRVGRLGASGSDSLTTHDVLVAVVNSARAVDVRPIRTGGLLVADECHRCGSAMNRLALDDRFARRLGLSATYAREDDGNLRWLDPYFGGTCFRLGYRRARAEGVTARFTLSLLGVAFAADEQARYHQLTETMGALRARLIHQHGLPDEPFESFMRAVNLLADGEGDGSAEARGWRQAMFERRRLLADTPAKDAAVAALAPAFGDADRALVFTQSIAAAERASRALAARGLRAGVAHSALPPAARREVLHRFGTGRIDVLAAPRVLDEGINVPAADLAVIAGASHSRRQMIQRMGRVLRRKPDGRRARFAVLYVEGTVEDPARGAHEAFLEEVLGVADTVERFPAGTAGPGRSAAARDALRPSWP